MGVINDIDPWKKYIKNYKFPKTRLEKLNPYLTWAAIIISLISIIITLTSSIIL